jgi:predicted dehydrogenase
LTAVAPAKDDNKNKEQDVVLRWGIIGAGDIADRGMAPAMANAPSASLVAVQRRDGEKAKAFAARHNVARSYNDVGKLLADPDVDAVYIGTPNVFHAAQTIMAAEAGKHVLCDKPMATTVADAEAMIEAAERNKVKLGVVFQNRYHPAHVAMRAEVKTGNVGEIDYAYAQLCRGSRRDGRKGWRVDPELAAFGAITGQALHPIDLLRYILGSEVEEVVAMSDEAPPERPVEEMIYATLRFANGAHGVVIAGTLIPRFDNDVTVYGSKARIAGTSTLGSWAKKGKAVEFTMDGEAGERKVTYERMMTAADHMAKMVEDFSRSILDGYEAQISAANGLQMVKIAVALQRSAREGRAIRMV